MNNYMTMADDSGHETMSDSSFMSTATSSTSSASSITHELLPNRLERMYALAECDDLATTTREIARLKEIWKTRWFGLLLSKKRDGVLIESSNYVIGYSYEPGVVLAVVTVWFDGTIELVLPDCHSRLHTWKYDITAGIHLLMKCAFRNAWTYNDLQLSHGDGSACQPFATSWLCMYLHDNNKLVGYDNLLLEEKNMEAAILAGRNPSPNIIRRVRSMCVFRNALVCPKKTREIPRLVIQGRPAIHRRVCTLSDLTQHSPTRCGCPKCKPAADFPYVVTKKGTKEPLPVNCHVCINGTVAFDTPEGVFAIENFKRDLKNVRISNMPCKSDRKDSSTTYEQLKSKGFTLMYDEKCEAYMRILSEKKRKNIKKSKEPVV